MDHPLAISGRQLQVAWLAALDAIEQAHQAKSQVRNSCQLSLCPTTTVYLREWDTEPSLQSLFVNFVDHLSCAAAGYLGGLGVTMSYDIRQFYSWPDRRTIRRRLNVDDDFKVDLKIAREQSLVSVGEALAKFLTPENARQTALTQAADRVFEEFSPRGYGQDNKVITARGNRRILTKRIYGNSFGRAWSLSYNCADSISQLIIAMQTLMAASEMSEAMSPHLVTFATRFLQDREYASRMKLQLGPGLEMVFFKEKVELVFSADALAALQVTMLTNRTQTERAA